MKKAVNDFEKYVRTMRNSLPVYSNGRNVVVLSEYSKKGQNILARGSRWEGNNLSQVYEYPSRDKQIAFDDVYEMYANDSKSESFGICSHNCQMFTVSWLNEYGMVYLTNKTEYLVLINE